MYRRHIGRRLLVIVQDGTIDGTLTAVDKAEGLSLEHATFLPDEPGKEPMPMDGLVLVPLASIVFAQVV